MPAPDWTPERFEEIADFWANRLVLESAVLDVYAQLTEGPLGSDELAQRLELDSRAALLLFDALAGLGLLVKTGNRYSNSDSATRFLVRSSPDYLGHRLIASQHNWEMWGRLPAALRTGQRQREKRIFHEDPEAARNLLLSLHRDARSLAVDLLERGAIDLEGRTHMLDLGGGAGTYSVVFCRAYPRLNVTLVDRPIPAEVARDVVASAGLEGRIKILEYDLDDGDFRSDFDFVWISNVIHSRSDEANRALLERLYERVRPGGEVAIHDMVMEENRTQPVRGAVFSIHMLLSNAVGRCYTYREVHGWLRGAGFRDVRWIHPDAGDMTLVIGRR